MPIHGNRGQNSLGDNTIFASRIESQAFAIASILLAAEPARFGVSEPAPSVGRERIARLRVVGCGVALRPPAPGFRRAMMPPWRCSIEERNQLNKGERLGEISFLDVRRFTPRLTRHPAHLGSRPVQFLCNCAWKITQDAGMA